MNNTLFIGNGLNRSISNDNNISWDNLIKIIAKDKDKDEGKVDFPLEFEIIANKILSKQSKPSVELYTELKKKIAVQIKTLTLPESAPHYEFTKLPVNNILTTNYDYLLENSLDSEFNNKTFPASPNVGNTKYSLKTSRNLKGKNIYHVHGEIGYINTICLGYEHYAGYLENMRSVLYKENSLPIKEAMLNPEKSTGTWMEYFFTDNIDIVGFGLKQCEIDIWWLLTFRAYLFYSNYEGMRELIKNKIIFHDICKCNNETKNKEIDKNSEDKNMKYALENLHVKYVSYIIENDKDYYNAYIDIAKGINNKL